MNNSEENKKIILLDGFAMMFRSFYAVKFSPKHNGLDLNAVYGCVTTILQALEQFNPDYVVCCFDAPEKTFRHEKDPEYKAQRTKAPDEFVAQIDFAKDLIKAFDIPLLIKPGFEADDIIGTLCKRAEKKNISSYILSGDLDFLQLMNDHIHLAKFNGKEPLIFNPEMTKEKLGVPPHQVIDYKAICGDSSDNYKGVPGVGPKGAVKLLQEYETLENIYENLDDLAPKLKAKFEDNKDYAFHCQHLAEIHLSVPVDFEFNEYKYPRKQIREFLQSISFNRLVDRAQNISYQSYKASKKDEDFDFPDENSQMSLF